MTTLTGGSLNPAVRELEGCRAALDTAGDLPDLAVTVPLMNSGDYQDRLRAEYWQTKIRYEKLRKANTKNEAERIQRNAGKGPLTMTPEAAAKAQYIVPLMEDQQHVMAQYLHILELRAEVGGIIL